MATAQHRCRVSAGRWTFAGAWLLLTLWPLIVRWLTVICRVSGFASRRRSPARQFDLPALLCYTPCQIEKSLRLYGVRAVTKSAVAALAGDTPSQDPLTVGMRRLLLDDQDAKRGGIGTVTADFPHTIADLGSGDHLCCIYETEEEHQAVLTPFLRQGLERGEKVVYIVDARTAETILGYLQDTGLDVEPYLVRGQLAILTRDDTHVREGVFDPDEMIALLRAEMEGALAEGYPALRVTGEMTWVLQGLPGSERLIEYEARLNEFFPGSQCAGLCQYDRRCFDPAVLLDVLRAHPIVIVGTVVYDNSYYIPPAELLGGDLPPVMLRHWLENLAERKRAEEELQRLYEQAQRDAEIKATLLQEVNHRVKNNLSAIIGLLYAEQRYAKAEDQSALRAMTEDLSVRIHALALVHSMLSEAEWSPLPLSDLAGQVIRSSLQILPRHKQVSVDVTPSSVQMTPQQANSLALVLNELATNTIKHALQERQAVHISVRIALENDDDTVLLEFRDDGPGHPEEVLQLKSRNVGLYLIQTIVRDDLRGELALRNDQGAVTTIRFKQVQKCVAPERSRG